MKLWIVKRTVEYEGAVLMGIYTELPKAKKAVAEQLERPVYKKFRQVGDKRWNYEDVWLEIQEVEPDKKFLDF
jgi:hypothetical protein